VTAGHPKKWGSISRRENIQCQDRICGPQSLLRKIQEAHSLGYKAGHSFPSAAQLERHER
jgi:hypothetical protein